MKVMAQPPVSNGKAKVKVNGGASGSDEVICLDSDSDDDTAKTTQPGYDSFTITRVYDYFKLAYHYFNLAQHI
jgi:hypothetical protein